MITRAPDSIERRRAPRLTDRSNQTRVLGTDETNIKEFPEGSGNNEEVPSSSILHPENLATLTEEARDPIQSEILRKSKIVEEEAGATNITTDS